MKKTFPFVISVVAILSLFSTYSVFALSKTSNFKCGANKWKLSFSGEFQIGGGVVDPAIRSTSGSIDNILAATKQGCEFRVQVIDTRQGVYSPDNQTHRIFNCNNIDAYIPGAPDTDTPSWTCLAYRGFQEDFSEAGYDESKMGNKISEWQIGFYTNRDNREGNVLKPYFKGTISKTTNSQTHSIFWDPEVNGTIRIYTKE